EGKSEQEIIEILQQKSRDNARTAMQWTADYQAGFTTGEPWIAVANNYREINVENAVGDPHSIFHHYKQLITLRKNYDIIVYGDFELLLETHPYVFAYKRKYQDETLIVVNNFYAEEIEVHFQEEIGNKQILLSNYPDSTVNLEHITLRPYESIVYYIS